MSFSAGRPGRPVQAASLTLYSMANRIAASTVEIPGSELKKEFKEVTGPGRAAQLAGGLSWDQHPAATAAHHRLRP